MSDRRKSVIITYTGRQIDPFNPDPQQISSLDIQQSLSIQKRFCGHTKEALSIAQHCVLVSTLCQTLEGQRWGLVHDASEVYISDVPRPLKKHLPLFKDVEERLFKAIAVRYSLSYPMPEEVAFYDTVALYWESRDLMLHGAVIPRPAGFEEPQEKIVAWDTETAAQRWNERMLELWGCTI